MIYPQAVGLSPDDQLDPNQIQAYIAGRQALNPSIPPAAMNPSGSSYGQGFSPDADQSWGSGRWYGDAPDPAAFNVSAGGSSGLGTTAQPEADTKGSGEISAGAGNVMTGKAKMPPPGTEDPVTPYSPPAALPVQSTASTQPAPNVPNPPAPVSDQSQIANDAVARMAARQAPEKKENWGQRLALAVLAATKLAPYAQQIVHPAYSGQMATYNAANAQDAGVAKAAESAANTDYAGVLKSAEAQRQQEQGADYAARELERQRATQERERIARETNFTKSLGKPEDIIEHLPANDPQIPQLQQQGWQILDDIRYPPDMGMKVAKPPATVQVNAQNLSMLPGHTIGEVIPWSEYKTSLTKYQDQQRQLAVEGAKTPHQGFNPTAIAMRASGAQTGIPEIDAMTPQQAEKARDKPATVNVNNSPDNLASNAELIANYQQAPLSGFAMSRPEGQAIMAQVHKLNHDYHAEYYNNFNRTESDATTGKIGNSANALNTMMGHLDILDKAAVALKNNDVQLLNRLANETGAQVGNSAVTTYQTIVHRLGPEVTKAYVGGGGSALERGANESDFDPKMSPDQLRGNVRVSAQLAESKIKALQDQYNRGTYGRGQQKLISDEAESVRQRLAGGGVGRAIEQHSPSTGQYRHSTDGGKTWLPGRAQSPQ